MTARPDLSTEHRDRALAAFTAAQAGDFGPALSGLHPDIVWTNDTAAGPWAGTFRGVDAVATMLLEFTAFMEGTFHQDLLDLAGSDDHVVLVLRERGERAGHRFDNRAVYVQRLVDGLTVEVYTRDRDREAAAEFWTAVGAAVPVTDDPPLVGAANGAP